MQRASGIDFDQCRVQSGQQRGEIVRNGGSDNVEVHIEVRVD
jgi:hypothetical protein